LHWFENYLSDRNQKVVLPDCFSEVWNVKGGVPQGSVKTPLRNTQMFMIYYKFNILIIEKYLRFNICNENLQLVNKMVSGF
jgi:hypothetical protein